MPAILEALDPCPGCEPTVNGTAPPPGDGDCCGNYQANGMLGGPMDTGGPVADGADFGLLTGATYRSHETSEYQSQGETRDVTLQYNSLHAKAEPFVELAYTILPGDQGANIRSILVTWTVDAGTSHSVLYPRPNGLNPGTYRLTLLIGDSALATGLHSVAVIATRNYASGPPRPTSITVNMPIVNDASAKLGAGWSIEGLQQIYEGTPGQPVVVTAGSRGTEVFTPSGSVYVGAAWDPSVLSKSGSTWTRGYPDGTSVGFDATGRETSMTDRNGNVTTYAYLASGTATGELATITDPVGKITTLAYDATSGRLATITDPASRITTVIHDGLGNLVSIADPDGARTTFAYSTPTDHRMSGVTNPNNKTAAFTYGSFGRVSGVTQFDGATTAQTQSAQVRAGAKDMDSTATLWPIDDYKGSVTDPNNHTTTLTFDRAGHYTTIENAGNSSSGVTRDSHGWPITYPSGINLVTTLAYDSRGNVTTITRADGSSMRVEYDATYSRPTRLVDYRGLVTSFALDSKGNTTRRTDPDLGHEDWTYNAAGQVLTDTDRSGRVTTLAYDSSGRLTTLTLANAGSGVANVVLAYDAAGNVTSVADELGQITRMTYDSVNRLLSAADPLQYAAGKATILAYDAAGNVTSVTDALNHATSYVYDARNRLVGIIDPINQGTGRRTTLTYLFDLIGITDPNGNSATFTYDPVGRLVRSQDELNHATTYTYDLMGRTVAVTDANNHTTSYAYDLVGRLATVTYPGTAPNSSGTLVPVTYGYHYNDNDQPVSVTDALGHTATTTYDNLGRPTAITDALNNATSFGYDLVGNRTTVTDPNSRVTTYVYDARNRLQTETLPAGGGTTTYTYDQASRVTSLHDAALNVTSWAYDNANRPTVETDPRGKLTTTAYDLVGRVTQVIDRNGRITQYGYDANDRPVTETWKSGATTLRIVTTTYDPAGRVTDIQDPDSHYVYTYDGANRLTTVDNGGTSALPRVTLTYGYDPANNRTSLADTKGGRTTYTYDVRDMVVSIAQSGTGVAAKRVDFAYDAALRRTTLTRYSNTAGTTTVQVTKYAYDAADRLTTLTHQTSGGTVRSQYVYTLDAANRLTSEARTWQNGGTQTDTVGYTYTDDNQLTGVSHTNVAFAAESFSYDSVGNRTMAGYATTTGNRLSNDGTYTYAYDDEGNLTTRTETATGNQTLYTWDHRNRLTKVESKVGATTTTVAQYTYDALNRRIKVVAGATTRATLYDGLAAILDFNGSGTQTARYLQGPVIDEIMAREVSGTTSWYLTDRQGTVRDLVNNAGAVIDHIDYNSFGNIVAESASSSGDRWKYTGREFDDVTGLYYYRARYYDPKSGRFISEDPLEFNGDGVNFYSYVGNGTPNAQDPTGLISIFFDGYAQKAGKRTTVQLLHKLTTDPHKQLFLNPWNHVGHLCPLDNIAEAYSYVLKVHKQFPNEKIYLYGWSRGGAQALLLAEALGRSNISVEFVGVIDPVTTPLYCELTVNHHVKKLYVAGKDGTNAALSDISMFWTAWPYIDPEGMSTKQHLFDMMFYRYPTNHAQSGYYRSNPAILTDLFRYAVSSGAPFPTPVDF